VKFSIIPLKSGNKAKIYTIQFEDQSISEYYRFVDDHKSEYPEIVNELDVRLTYMVRNYGIPDHFFKRESPKPYNVFRIENTEDLRIYCIKFSNVAIVLGNGGIKLPDTIKLNENPDLQKIRNLLMGIEDLITDRIKTGDVIINDKELKGNLTFDTEDLL